MSPSSPRGLRDPNPGSGPLDLASGTSTYCQPPWQGWERTEGWQSPAAPAAADPPASSTETLPSKPGTGISLLAETWPAPGGNLVPRVNRLTT